MNVRQKGSAKLTLQRSSKSDSTSSPTSRKNKTQEAKERRSAEFQQARAKVELRQYVGDFPKVSPVELARLVVEMGLQNDEKGPSQAMILIGRCASAIDHHEATFRRLDEVLRKDDVDRLDLLEKIGFSPEDRPDGWSLPQIMKKLNTNRLMVDGRTYRGQKLFEKFTEKVDRNLGALKKKTVQAGASFTSKEVGELAAKFVRWRQDLRDRNIRAAKKKPQMQ